MGNPSIRRAGLWLILAPTLLAAQQEPHHRVKLDLRAPGTYERLGRLGLATDHGEHKTGQWFITDLSETEVGLLRSAGIAHEVLVRDVAAHYRARNAQGAPKDGGSRSTCDPPPQFPVPAHFALGSMGGYLTWQEMLDVLDAMHAQYPGLITAKQPIGTSLEGRPIHVVRISDNPGMDEGEPQVLYTALHHAREPNSLMQLLFFMWHLLERYGTDPEATYLVNHLDMHFVPCVNPDGYVYNETTDPEGGGMWRKNRRDNGDGSFGVDLNRNYGFGWGYNDQGSSPDPNSQVYRGTGPFSEPETQALRDHCEAHLFRFALNNHTFGNLLIYPWGYLPDTFTPDSALFVNHAKLLTRENGYRFGTADQTVNYTVNGGSDDWMYGEQGTKPKILSMTPEAGDASDGFWPPSWRITDICLGSMPQNLHLAHLALSHALVEDRAPHLLPIDDPVIPFSITRLGLEPGDLTVSLEPLENVASTGAPVVYSGLELLQQEQGSIGFQPAAGLPDGSTVRLVLALDNGALTFRDTLTKVVGTPVTVFADGGNSMANWQSGSWGITTSQWYSPPGSITDSPQGNYAANANTSITLATPIDLGNATAATLTFMAKWDLESGYDFVQVLASGNYGPWTPLCGKHTRPGSVYQDAGEPIYDGSQNEWVAEEMSLDGFLGQQVRIRFRLGADSGLERDGFHFDDLAVTMTSALNTAVHASDDATLQVMPNPATDHCWITWAQRSPGPMVVRDALGRAVLELPATARHGSVRLDTSRLPAGLYTIALPGAPAAVQRLVVAGP